MPFNFESLEIPEVLLVIPRVFSDGRGFFLETYKYSAFKEKGICHEFVQDNYSKSAKGVLRGLHYQLNPKSQGKLVRVIRGSCLDIAVDIRKGSPNFGRHVSVVLDGKDQRMLWIPPGFAHGFCALEDTEFSYKTTEEYSPEHERGIRWDDPSLGIDWREKNPFVSTRDSLLPYFAVCENNFVYGGKE